ncbi:hypothetical protein [Cohnella fermenti]|uniref:Uncharacterized protein n=1 Tax=Cohnella fermenti TaxID=2565925 RepID=A0A4S4BGG5_9BACL|nr:hypothetical protein [Cohnella fermenti]THF73320.1 hypothetical protein E6C55_29835 [Cohnella fermenti]
MMGVTTGETGGKSMVEFDVIVNGKVEETIRPKTQKLREIYELLNGRMMNGLKRKYGVGVQVRRRMVY